MVLAEIPVSAVVVNRDRVVAFAVVVGAILVAAVVVGERVVAFAVVLEAIVLSEVVVAVGTILPSAVVVDRD